MPNFSAYLQNVSARLAKGGFECRDKPSVEDTELARLNASGKPVNQEFQTKLSDDLGSLSFSLFGVRKKGFRGWYDYISVSNVEGINPGTIDRYYQVMSGLARVYDDLRSTNPRTAILAIASGETTADALSSVKELSPLHMVDTPLPNYQKFSRGVPLLVLPVLVNLGTGVLTFNESLPRLVARGIHQRAHEMSREYLQP